MKGGDAVEIAGLVVCRQRPMTAKGIIFLLIEDEFGLVNVLVSKELSEQFRTRSAANPSFAPRASSKNALASNARSSRPTSLRWCRVRYSAPPRASPGVSSGGR